MENKAVNVRCIGFFYLFNIFSCLSDRTKMILKPSSLRMMCALKAKWHLGPKTLYQKVSPNLCRALRQRDFSYMNIKE